MKALLLATTLAALGLTAAHAESTKVTVHAVANNAKVMGTHVGGVRIVIQDAATGQVLAEGVQTGGTGDTGKIMSPRAPGADVYGGEDTAAFTADLDLAVPTVVDITAYGPLGAPQATMKTSKRLLLVPGQNVDGDGVVLEMNGLRVLITKAPVAAAPGAPIPVTAEVTMMCGCPTQPGGMWDSSKMTITAELVKDGKVAASAPLAYAGTVNTYSGQITPPDAGAYELEVVASQPAEANFGMASQTVAVGP